MLPDGVQRRRARRGACASAARRPPTCGSPTARCGGTASGCWASTRSACAARTTSRTRWSRRRSRCRSERRSRSRGPARRSPASRTASRRSPTHDGVALRQRLEGHERRLDDRRAALVPVRRAPHPGRPWQGPGLHPAARRSSPSAAPRVHLIGEAAERSARRRSGPASLGRRPRARRRPRPLARAGRATSSCSRRRARASTSTPTSRPAGDALPQDRRADASKGVRVSRRRSPSPRRAAEQTARAPHPADRHALPAGGRRGDGLQRLERADAAEPARATGRPTSSSTSPTARSGSSRCTSPRGCTSTSSAAPRRSCSASRSSSACS